MKFYYKFPVINLQCKYINHKKITGVFGEVPLKCKCLHFVQMFQKILTIFGEMSVEQQVYLLSSQYLVGMLSKAELTC